MANKRIVEGDIDTLIEKRFFSDSPKAGVCIDVGAASPDYLSVSAHFRDLGWRVLPVEANPEFCKLYRERQLEVLEYACGDHNADNVDFQVVGAPHTGEKYLGGEVSYESFSSLGIKPSYRVLMSDQHTASSRTIQVKLRTLNTILKTHAPDIQTIDLLTIDMEGWELEVLQGLDIDRYQPRVIVIENIFKEPAYVSFLKARGYTLWQRMEPNDIYIQNSMVPPMDLTSNRVLTPKDREALQPVIQELHELCPDIMSRKYPEAVFQNAFNFQQARSLARKTDKIILVGGYEDPIGPSLQHLGYDVTITDPQIDGRDLMNVWTDSLHGATRYDMVVSCSVLEHVENDVLFIQQIYQLLKPGGVALLTTDFMEDWRPGVPKPDTDVRLYTVARLKMLADALPPGSLLEPASWAYHAPYFKCGGGHYGFCSIGFRHVSSEAEHQTLVANTLLTQLDHNYRLNLRQQADLDRRQQQLRQITEEASILRARVAQQDDMTAGIGGRTLRVGLGVARRVSRLAKVCRRSLSFKSPQDAV